MKTFDLGELVLLAALWGASFLFMRLGVTCKALAKALTLMPKGCR